MVVLQWDQTSERLYETGVDRGVLYLRDEAGAYDSGYAWNGLVSVTESPSGAEPTPIYADNLKYLTLLSAEEFGGTIEAFTWPDEFNQCDGTAELASGIVIGQQPRKTFGLCYRTILGNDVDGNAHGYKLHLVYGGLASPSEKAYTTVNDSPEATTFSWEFTTTAVEVPGFNPSSTLIVDSTKVLAADLLELEQLLYGTASTVASLPLPEDVIALVGL